MSELLPKAASMARFCVEAQIHLGRQQGVGQWRATVTRPCHSLSPSFFLSGHDARPLLDFSQRYVFLCVCREAHSERLRAGGVVLWSRSFTPAASHTAASSTSPVNSLVREALIEGRGSDGKYEKDGYAVKWTFVNDLELIFVVRAICFPSQTPVASQPFSTPGRRLRTSAYCNSHTSMSSSLPSRLCSSNSSSPSSLLSLLHSMSPTPPSCLLP